MAPHAAQSCRFGGAEVAGAQWRMLGSIPLRGIRPIAGNSPSHDSIRSSCPRKFRPNTKKRGAALARRPSLQSRRTACVLHDLGRHRHEGLVLLTLDVRLAEELTEDRQVTQEGQLAEGVLLDRKSTRLNSSH